MSDPMSRFLYKHPCNFLPGKEKKKTTTKNMDTAEGVHDDLNE